VIGWATTEVNGGRTPSPAEERMNSEDKAAGKLKDRLNSSLSSQATGMPEGEPGGWPITMPRNPQMMSGAPIRSLRQCRWPRVEMNVKGRWTEKQSHSPAYGSVLITSAE
jgi:hypothetical protein